MAAALTTFDTGVTCPAIISAARMPVLRHLPSGIAPLDSLLGGGFARGMVTEISGEASAGKTQLLMQLAIQAALPSAIGGLSSRAVIISSEGRFPVSRLQSMSKAVWRNLSKEQLRVCGLQGVTRESLWSQHIIKEARTADDMVLACEQATRWLKANSRTDATSPAAGLVLVDSIAAPFRTREEEPASALAGRDGEVSKRPRPSSHGGAWFGARTKALLGISSELRALAASFNVPVVLTNQVTALVSDNDAVAGASHIAGLSASPAFTPALGLSWAHGMHIRMLLLRGDRRAGSVAATRRRLRLVFHPAVEGGEVLCELGEAGLVGIA